MLKNNIKNIKIVCSIMLFIALFNNPYSYYQILKWVTTISFVYLANHYFKSNMENFCWMFIALAVLYNPIAPISFERSTWEIVNILTIFVLVYSFRNKEYVS